MSEFNFSADTPIANLLKEATLVKSTSEAMRMIKQGAVKVDGEKMADSKQTFEQGSSLVFQVGKCRFARKEIS